MSAATIRQFAMAASAGMLLFAVGCKGSDTAQASAPDETVMISAENVVVVASERLESGPTISGDLTPEQSASIRAEVGGSVMATYVEAGQRVAKGTRLAKIDDTGNPPVSPVGIRARIHHVRGLFPTRTMRVPLARSCHASLSRSTHAHQKPNPPASSDSVPTTNRTHAARVVTGPPSAATTRSRHGRMPSVWPPRRQLSTAYAPVTSQHASHSSSCSALNGAMVSRPPWPARVKAAVNNADSSNHNATTGNAS